VFRQLPTTVNNRIGSTHITSDRLDQSIIQPRLLVYLVFCGPAIISRAALNACCSITLTQEYRGWKYTAVLEYCTLLIVCVTAGAGMHCLPVILVWPYQQFLTHSRLCGNTQNVGAVIDGTRGTYARTESAILHILSAFLAAGKHRYRDALIRVHRRLLLCDYHNGIPLPYNDGSLIGAGESGRNLKVILRYMSSRACTAASTHADFDRVIVLWECKIHLWENTTYHLTSKCWINMTQKTLKNTARLEGYLCE
jgi:hypothetical protein